MLKMQSEAVVNRGGRGRKLGWECLAVGSTFYNEHFVNNAIADGSMADSVNCAVGTTFNKMLVDKST
jgi:hypothetical protein